MKTIGVFDSGIGGKSIANTLELSLPNDKIIFLDDHENMPYGTKTPEQVLSLVVPKLKQLVELGANIIVIACNTVTTEHIAKLREIIKIPLVGIEPMVKPAAELTKSGIFAVCATPGTLASERYIWLKKTFAQNKKVIEPDCSDWALMIENNNINHDKIKQQIEEVCNAGADVIVLGCTHYHWIEQTIHEFAAGRAQIIQPEQAIVKRVKQVLEQLC